MCFDCVVDKSGDLKEELTTKYLKHEHYKTVSSRTPVLAVRVDVASKKEMCFECLWHSDILTRLIHLDT